MPPCFLLPYPLTENPSQFIILAGPSQDSGLHSSATPNPGRWPALLSPGSGTSQISLLLSRFLDDSCCSLSEMGSRSGSCHLPSPLGAVVRTTCLSSPWTEHFSLVQFLPITRTNPSGPQIVDVAFQGGSSLSQ